MTSAFQQVIDNDGFKNSAIAINAQQLAQDIKSWSAENKDKFEEFGKVIVMKMEKVFVGTKKNIINRDKLWRNYFLLQSSKHFMEEWEKIFGFSTNCNQVKKCTTTAIPEIDRHHTQRANKGTLSNM